jgi:5-methylcytosine-specific restriction endonuclease McrA
MIAEDRSSDTRLCVRAGEYPSVRDEIQRHKHSLMSKFRIMALTLDYPENWSEIAATVKQAAGYRCNRCGLKCLPPHDSYRHLDLSLRRKLSAQVHHLDGNPAQNDKSNLVCLCSGCHLRMHRHRPQPTPGQLSLKLKLPKVRRSRQHKQNWQLTLADLIDRLPRLSVDLHQQLELDLDNNSLERQLLVHKAK